MKIKKILLLLSLAYFTSSAFANDAVNAPSISLTGYYVNANSDHGYDSDAYGVGGTFTSAIPNTNNLGASASLSQEHTNGDNADIKTSSNQTNIGVNLFLRNSNLGGVLAGYTHSHTKDKIKFPAATGLGRISDSSNEDIKTLKGEYYLDQVTLAARLANSDESRQEGIAATWYPKDNHAISIMADHLRVNLNNLPDPSITTYAIQTESQPEMFTGKGNLRFGYFWSTQGSGNAIAVGADYYLSNFEVMKSTPAIGLSLMHSTGGTNTIGLNFGFKFDNSISLKDRDRKYLFNSNL